jgi:hypothetical protein
MALPTAEQSRSPEANPNPHCARPPSLSTDTFTTKHAHGEYFSHGRRQLMLHLEGDEDNVGCDEESQ